MPNTRTLAQLRTAVQARGQYENSTDITSALLDDFLNEAIAEVYDLLVGKWEDYYTTSTVQLLTPGTDTYALPATFYKLRKIELAGNDGSGQATQPRRHLLPYDLSVSHEYRDGGSPYRPRYRIQAGNLVLSSSGWVNQVLVIYFIPFAPRLVADADTFDGINNYEELVVQFALLRCKSREELPTAEIEGEIARLSQRIRSAADSRDASEAFSLDPHGPPGGRYDDDDSYWWV